MHTHYQIVSENGTHIFVTFHISNLTSFAQIDPATNVTAQQAVDLITSNTIGSPVPFQVQISPNISVTASLHVAGRRPHVPKCDNSSLNTTDNKTMTSITTQSGLSSGAVAGIALSLLILGIIIGVILQLTVGVVIRWYRTSRSAINIGESVMYKKQDEKASLP